MTTAVGSHQPVQIAARIVLVAPRAIERQASRRSRIRSGSDNRSSSATLERTVGQKLTLAPWRFERDALHQR
jgi:hypothetical protein